MSPSPDPSRFRCTECGDCCRRHRAPLTVSDVERLVASTGEAVAALVDWLSPDEVDMTGEPESFVVLREGRRLPVLAFRGGACRFLDPMERCAVYAARPLACRTFPLELEDSPANGSRRHLTVLEGAECPGAFDGEPDAPRFTSALEMRQVELTEHVERVTAWNRSQRRRALAGRRAESRESFVETMMEVPKDAVGQVD